ncbi:hypothetical protein ABEB36_008158 [Hypothenemus hampei]|uniref:Gustatory receptor n=1 Tax=Hypothenemus hampei TaxID=57062 RepID=A0ABD1EQ14_HYPHA
MLQADITPNSLNFLIKLGQSLLFLPIGFRNGRFSKFMWLSKRAMAANFLTAISSLQFILYCNYFFKLENQLPASSELIFYFSALVYKILLINVAKSYAILMEKWQQIDTLMENYTETNNFRLKIKLVSLLLFLLALGDHIFFIASLGIFFNSMSIKDEIEEYFATIFEYFFIVVPYNGVLAIFLQLLNWLWTILWNYVDVFLMALCLCFTFRLGQIEQRVNILIENKVEEVYYWKQIRKHYVQLTELCLELENCIAQLILASFFGKFYMALYRLLGLLDGEKYGIQSDSTKLFNKLYYGFSLLFVLLRMMTVTICASTIDLKNKDIMFKLFAVSSDIYNIEIERFIMHIHVFPPTITAKLFEMKRSLVFKIASSIIIYELVIIKFYKY